MLQLQFGPGSLEETLVLRIGARPAALNVVDPEFVQFRRNQQLVINGKRDGLALSAIPKRGVERVDLIGEKQKGGVVPPLPSFYFFAAVAAGPAPEERRLLSAS